LKENVIIGKIIPAGTGMAKYREMEPKTVGEKPESVYSISDIEAQMKRQSASDGTAADGTAPDDDPSISATKTATKPKDSDK
jgi:DNA-directed RNA polymerase subunit beta'